MGMVGAATDVQLNHVAGDEHGARHGRPVSVVGRYDPRLVAPVPPPPVGLGLQGLDPPPQPLIVMATPERAIMRAQS